MSDGSGFTSMAAATSAGDAPEVGVGMLGYAFMGKAHSNAMLKIPHMMYPPPAIPKLVGIAGRNEAAVSEAAKRFGYEGYYTDWRDMLANDAIQLFDNGGPNDAHAEPCIMAAEAGKHILCEKPLARTAEESKTMLDAVNKANIKHMVAFNYRFVPAIRQIRQLVDSGALGQIYHFRACYLQEWIMPHYNMPMIWRLQKSVAGSGALGDLGAHIIDLGRYLVGEISSVSAMAKTFIPERQWEDGSTGTVDVDDAFAAVVEFENGALGTLEATRFAGGRKNGQTIEINAEKGSIRFNLERLNELEVFWVDGAGPKETQGFTNVLVSEPYHPWWENWWPQGHMIGWEHTFVHEITHLLDCIVNDKDVAPIGADFEDGYRAAVVCDAIIDSAESKRQVDCQY
ncbi:MAG: Gfo/Idh/MocA family oxidoreductase [Chloroflexota bacterium]